MITRETLKQIFMMKHLSDKMLDELIPIAEVLQYNEKEYIFRQGDKADRYSFLLQGKVLIEDRISSEMTVSLVSIKPGYSIGWSSMMDEEDEFYTSDAICAEPTQLISFQAEKLKALFQKDYQLGYILSHQLLHVIKTRYDTLTSKFIQVIKNHPEMGALL